MSATVTVRRDEAVGQATPAPIGASVLHCATVFVSAFLLFSVQPLMGRLILPLFGGSAFVWSACMVFFQAFLLLGYVYADWTSRMSPRAQGWTHAILLTSSLALLPLRLQLGAGAALEPTLRIPLILAISVGAPYFLLCATSPLVQVWYARERGKAPYRLYALSNLASLLALIAYPSIIEPRLTVHRQLVAWSVAFTTFVGLCAVSALLATRGTPMEKTGRHRSAPGPAARLRWVAFSAIPSALLLATTNHLCQNVAAIPFLWVAPLVAYLLTLILCFDYDSPRRHRVFLWLTPPALIAMAYASMHASFGTNPRVLVPLFTTGLFVVCMAIHGELVMRKPDPIYSTSFYVMVSLGGVTGGALVVWVAPFALRGVFEMPILMVIAAIVLLFTYYRKRWYIDAVWAATSVTVLVYAMAQIQAFSAGTTVAVRNFYGALRIVDSRLADGSAIRTMAHGTVSHGTQYRDLARQSQATTYYAPGTGVQMAIEDLRQGPQSAGIIGLGAGTLAAYVKPGDHFVFYELNPQVIDLARREFTYLNVSGTEVVEGDGRLALDRDPRVFDLVLVDAFSGDAIPTHLLTAEAVQIYLRHLKPGGILGMHISNSVLDLESPVAKLAESAGLAAELIHTPDDPSIDRSEAIWMIMARSAERLRHPTVDKVGRAPRTRPGQRLWTDDYSNLFQLLKTQ